MLTWIRKHRPEAWLRVTFFVALVLLGGHAARTHGFNNWLVDLVSVALIWYVTGSVIRKAYREP